MRFFHVGKDGGPYSTVTGYWLVEIKSLLSIALLKFENGSRDEYHTHAFNSISWLLRGHLREEHLHGCEYHYFPGPNPIPTLRSTFHRVFSEGTSWVLTIRGPWWEQWKEYNGLNKTLSVLVNGRVVVKRSERDL